MTTATAKRITICGNWDPDGPDSLWAGDGKVQDGQIECSAELHGNAYDQIESQISDGQESGEVHVTDGDRDVIYRWEIS